MDRLDEMEIFVAIVLLIGTIYYFTVQVKKSDQVLEEHRADLDYMPPAPRGDAAP